jgi:molybdenum cofactor cytidylyltransferase
MTRDKIFAIILAAGESKRMKVTKMLLPYKGKTIIENVIENVLSSNIEKVLVVTGAEYDAITYVLNGLRVTPCFNEHYREGMLSSVKCGFRSLPDDADCALIFQGDQPFIASGTINKIITACMNSDKGIVVPVYNGKRGHPILIKNKYRKEIDRLKADEGLRFLSKTFPEDVLEVETDAPEILRDIDTMEDYLNETHMIDPNHQHK